MRKTRSQTQAESAPSTSTRNFARATAPGGKTASSAPRTIDHDKSDNAVTSTPQASAPLPQTNQSSRSAPEHDAAKLKEYQDMIQTFRVIDLHKVLQFLNLSITGRKHELQQRVLDLLKTNFEVVSAKLREIYRSDYYSQRNVQYGPPDPKRMFSHMQMPTVQSSADVRSAMVSVGNVGGAGGGGVGGVGGNGGGGVGGGVPGAMGVPFQHAIGASMPIHPDVRLKKLAFYDVLATLIKPSSLLPRTNQRIQELPFYFTLTPQQATEIATNRDIRNGCKVEHSIQVQLRFCLLETSCEQEDCFPSNVIVKVNNKVCPLPNPIPTNRPNVEPKRPPRPVNVTSNVKLSPTVTNTIIIQWCPDFSRGYCIAAYLVKKLTSSQLLHRMKTKGVKPADYTRGLIKEKLTEDADCEIATTMLKVSLNCPLGKMKMSIPCRASTCSHLQCFDANLYLQMNERKPTWNCPVCDKSAVYDNLVIDGYFQEVLASSLLGSEDTEIQLHKDGSWSTHNLRNETQLIDTPSKPVEKVELISDDIELITDDVKPLAKVPPPPVISNEPTSTTSSETVDLTLSDSDDDMPLAKRKTAAAKSAPTASAVSTSNGQRSTSVQSSHISKGALEGSFVDKERSLEPVCDISSKIRQYLKTCHIPSVIPTPLAVDQGKTVTQNRMKEMVAKSTRLKESCSNMVGRPEIPKNTQGEGYSIGAPSISIQYYGSGTDTTTDINNTTDGNLSDAFSLPCLDDRTDRFDSGVKAPKTNTKKTSESISRASKKQKPKRCSNLMGSSKNPSVVPFERILETTFGPGVDKSHIDKRQRNQLRKMWAIENRLQGTVSSTVTATTNSKRNSNTSPTSGPIQGYCPPPSTRSEATDTDLTSAASPDMGSPHSPQTIGNDVLAINAPTIVPVPLMSIKFTDTNFLPIRSPEISSLPSATSHITGSNISLPLATSNLAIDSTASKSKLAPSKKSSPKTRINHKIYRKMNKLLPDSVFRDYIADQNSNEKSRSLPDNLNFKRLLQLVTCDIDKLKELNVTMKTRLKNKQAGARQLLERCKLWKKPPRSVRDALEQGLI